MAFVIAGDGVVPFRSRNQRRTIALAPVTAGAAKLVPADIPYVTLGLLNVAMFGLQKSAAPHWLPARETGPVTRVEGATRSGLTRLPGFPRDENDGMRRAS